MNKIDIEKCDMIFADITEWQNMITRMERQAHGIMKSQQEKSKQNYFLTINAMMKLQVLNIAISLVEFMPTPLRSVEKIFSDCNKKYLTNTNFCGIIGLPNQKGT